MKYFVERKKKDDDVYRSDKEQRKRAAAATARAQQGWETISSSDELLQKVEEKYRRGDSVKVPKTLNGVLKDHQVVGFKWLCETYRRGVGGILGDDMGVGKTLQAISVVSHLVEVGVLKDAAPPALIIVPLSVLQNWVSEFERFAPEVRVLAYSGSKEERAEIRENISKDLNQLKVAKNDIYIPSVHCLVTTYELLKLDDFFTTAFNYPLCIIDEAHRLKNPKVADIFNTPKDSYGLKHIPVRFLLTGTPLQNSVLELWSLLNVACPVLFNAPDEFCEDWFPKVEEDKTQNAKIQKILKLMMLRRTKLTSNAAQASASPARFTTQLNSPRKPEEQARRGEDASNLAGAQQEAHIPCGQ
eukprot:TRINITY_DN15832_c1_g1_i1.p1 TRINITY_DN15832_c1_g1~~TRINITY_DN15832_c1_g1_i1.p1  ORF type:complete len:370 (+),score=70.26 TRINITY_DN15832_c1_g1_i1:37-1110(+)